MDFATATITGNGINLSVSHGDDKALFVTFEKVAVEQKFKSEEAGRPIYEDFDFIRIIYPGDKTKQTYRPVDLIGTAMVPADHIRFPNQWAAFQRQEEQVSSGTPITEYPPVGKSQALELKGMNIHTVEQLAALPDSALDSFVATRALREKAKLFLEDAAKGSVVTAQKAQIDDLTAKLEALQAQVKELSKPKKEK